jgi:hypothetical protein
VYLKWFWKPTERVEWYLNAFFGADGIGMNVKSDTVTLPSGATEKKDITNEFHFNWYNYDGFAVTGLKILPTDRIFIHWMGGYELVTSQVDGRMSDSGYRKYSSEFKSRYNALVNAPSNPDPAGYELDLDSRFHNERFTHNAQSRLDLDFQLHDKVTLSTGAGINYNFITYSEDDLIWTVMTENFQPVLKKIDYTQNDQNKNYIQSFAYLNLNLNLIPNRFKIELGCRIDHNYLMGDGFSLNTYPVPGPRINIIGTPVRNAGILEYLNLSAGFGMFSKSPFEMYFISKEFGIKDFEISAPKSLNTVAGIEMGFPLGIKFKLEGYYKYYFDRYYLNSVTGAGGKTEIRIHTDGTGHAGGFDFSLERKMARWLDGALSYSFMISRLYNPVTDNPASGTTLRGEPTGQWFYPSYHRFHSLNLILNIRPASWLTITPKFSLATGLPKKKFGDKTMFPAVMENGTVVEMYNIPSVYDDEARTDISIPFDLKIAFNFYYPKSKIRAEYYIAVEDLFSFIYTPKGGVTADPYTGEENKAPEANFNLPFPLPSFGFKISF